MTMQLLCWGICLEFNKEFAQQRDAVILLQSILIFNFLVFLPFWHDILKKFDRVQKRLQDPTMNFHESSLDIESLHMDITRIREAICHDSVLKAKEKCEL